MRLIYIANIRLPTERAHGLQIVQMCEAFADTLGASGSVSLWAARRWNTRDMRAVRDVWTHYGVRATFAIRRLPTLDLIPLVPDRTDLLARVIFYVQLVTFTLSALVGALVARVDICYTRDAFVILALSLVKPRRRLAYEVHRLGGEGGGAWMQRLALRRAGVVVPITQALADDLVAAGADAARLLVLHDGVRAERFADMPTQPDARLTLGIDAGAFVVAYVGRLTTLAMDKGVGTLVDAIQHMRDPRVALLLVGGPAVHADALRERWRRAGLDEARFLYQGQVAPADVPRCLAAADVCAMPHPRTPHFARHTSPLKLFEYMAARRPVVASNLPAFAEVVRDGVHALLVPPDDPAALAAALVRLRDNPALRDFLADAAFQRVMARYTWAERARQIVDRWR